MNNIKSASYYKLQLTKMGYKVKTDKTGCYTTVYEPFVSKVSGQIKLVEIAMTTNMNPLHFLKNCVEGLKK